MGTSRETAASLSAPWVNEENGYLKKFQASASPTQGAPPKASNDAAPPPVATCAWATDPYTSRETAASLSAPWVNEENGYLKKFQASASPTQGAPPKASNAAAPPPVATCAWATDPYTSRDTVAPRKAPWENEENGYLQKWQGRVVPTQPAAAPTHVR